MTAPIVRIRELVKEYRRGAEVVRVLDGLSLELVVGAQGRVKKASVEGGTISAASSECLVTTAKSLVLPPLGTDATLQVPLLLRQPGR